MTSRIDVLAITATPLTAIIFKIVDDLLKIFDSRPLVSVLRTKSDPYR
jgi:hypothetical protein